MPCLLGEGLDDTDPGEGLLQVGGDRADGLPRELVGVGARDAEEHRGGEEHREDQEDEAGELRVEQQQDHDGADQGQAGGEERRHRVGDERVERLDVVGHPRDEHAGGAPLVEGDRLALEMPEDLHPQVLQRALADPPGQVGLQVGADPDEDRRGDEEDHDHVEHALVAGLDPVVDRLLGERRRGERGAGADDERDEHERDPALVGREQQREPLELAPASARALQAAPQLVGVEAAHSPAVSGSRGLRVRKTESGRPFSTISR